MEETAGHTAVAGTRYGAMAIVGAVLVREACVWPVQGPVVLRARATVWVVHCLVGNCHEARTSVRRR